MGEQSLRNRLAELFATTDFTPAAPAPPLPSVVARHAEPITSRRLPDETPERQTVSRSSTRCDHQWEIRLPDRYRRCWKCGVQGAPVGGSDAPRVKVYDPIRRAVEPSEEPLQPEGTTEELMADVLAKAEALGHRFRPWRSRPNDQYGRRHAYCLMCNEMIVVGDQCAYGLARVYGAALLSRCGARRAI